MSESVPAFDPTELCLVCGLCCDGTLFSKVKIGDGDPVVRLKAAGLKIADRPEPEFAQPCPALQGDCHCRVYADRPAQCRKFECRLLTAASLGERTVPEAHGLIQTAKAQAALVRKCLRGLDETREDQALSLRYQETERRFRAGELMTGEDRDETAVAFAELTLAVYRLQALLRQDFYA